MRVLITGVAGFIGSRLAEALIGHGHEVYGIDNLSTGRPENIPPGVTWEQGDVAEGSTLRAIFRNQGPEVVYHCAASYADRSAWERDTKTNVLGTINVVRGCQSLGSRIVYFQTSLCYGPAPASPVRTSAPLDPRGSYAVSKTAGEAYIRDSGLDYVSLRLANMYGPRNLSGPVPTFYKRLSEGLPCTVVDARRDFVFIDDLVWVAVRAAEQGHGVYHVASGMDAPISDVFWAVAGAMGAEVPPPAITSRGPDDVATILLDPSETTREFGWTARTPLTAGIRKAVDWYESHGVTETYTHLTMKG